MPKVIAFVVFVAALALGWFYWQEHRFKPLVVSGFIEAHDVRVGSRIGGRVAEVLVEEGANVAANAPLLRLDPFDLKQTLAESEARRGAAAARLDRLVAGYRTEEIEQARAKRDRASANLARLVTGPRPEEIQIARADLESARASSELAQAEFERLEHLRQRDEAAKTEYDRAVRALKAARSDADAAEFRLNLLLEGSRAEDIAEARAAHAEAEQGLRLLETGYRTEEIAQARAELAAADAAVAAIRVRLDETTIASPCDCLVEAIDLRPGDLVAPNAPTVALLDMKTLWVRAYIPESRLGEARVGGPAVITVDSFPGEEFTGRVSFIARDGEFTPRNVQTPEERGRQVFRIKVHIETGIERLRVGMAADLHFPGEPKR